MYDSFEYPLSDYADLTDAECAAATAAAQKAHDLLMYNVTCEAIADYLDQGYTYVTAIPDEPQQSDDCPF